MNNLNFTPIRARGKTKLYICNKVGTIIKCKECSASVPHTHYDDDIVTMDGDRCDYDDTIRIKCTMINNDDYENIVITVKSYEELKPYQKMVKDKDDWFCFYHDKDKNNTIFYPPKIFNKQFNVVKTGVCYMVNDPGNYYGLFLYKNHYNLMVLPDNLFEL